MSLRPCLFRSSRCLGLQDKHNTRRGLRRKWSKLLSMVMFHSRPPRVLSCGLMMLAPPWLPSARLIVRNTLPHNGELRLRQCCRAACTIHKWIGGCRERAVLTCLGAQYAKRSESLNNLHVSNSLIGAIHYLSACAFIIWSLGLKPYCFYSIPSVCRRVLMFGFFRKSVWACYGSVCQDMQITVKR